MRNGKLTFFSRNASGGKMSGATTPTPKFAFLIFESGGAKGIAHLGALRAMEDLGYSFAGVAGASAGAFVAALVAAGYRSDELLDIASPTTNLLAAHGMKPTDLLGIASWSRMARLRRAIGRMQYAALAAGLPGAAIVAPGQIPTPYHLWRGRGHFTATGVRDFVNDCIRERLGDLWAAAGLDPAAVPNPVCFADLDYARFPELRSLKIVATDIDAGKAVLFDRVSTPDVAIGDAVAALISIPLVFRPAQVRRRDPAQAGVLAAGANRFADGGLVSNLPSWVFMDEKLALERTLANNVPVPIVAFALTEAPASPHSPEHAAGSAAHPAPPRDGFGGFLGKVGRSAIFGGQSISREFLRDLAVVELPTKLNVLEFDAPWAKIRGDYTLGRQNALRQVKERLETQPARIAAVLRATVEGVAARIDAVRGAANRAPLSHLRACRIEPLGAESLRVSHGYNMAADADDRLPLDCRSRRGAAEAFRTRDMEVIRFGPASPNAVMTKYEHALVRPGLRSALCIPISTSVSAWQIADLAARTVPCGVLSLDSDEDLSVEFDEPDLVSFVVEQSVLLSLSFGRGV